MYEAASAVRAFVVACGMAAAWLGAAGTAEAQRVELAFDEGLVSITAEDVPVRRVLDEWARLGQTLVVNADLLGDRRVSLRLDRVPQARAIAQILESAAGYVARRRAGPAGPSDFDLILVLATSEARSSGVVAADDPAGLDLWNLVPPADTDAGAAADLPAETARDPKKNVSENESNGREESARPSFGGMSALPAPAVPAEELPVGRPEGARPGTPTPAGAAPAEAPAEMPAVAQPPAGGGKPTDANGRPPRKP